MLRFRNAKEVQVGIAKKGRTRIAGCFIFLRSELPFENQAREHFKASSVSTRMSDPSATPGIFIPVMCVHSFPE